MPILVKSDDVRSGGKAKARHGRLGPARELLVLKRDVNSVPVARTYCTVDIIN